VHDTLAAIFREYPLPDHYLIVDLETTGYSPRDDLIVEIGWCKVRDRVLVEHNTRVLNWYAHAAVHPAWLTQALTRVRQHLGGQTSVRYTPGWLQSGVVPMDGLREFLAVLADTQRQPGAVIAGHNLLGFDCRVLAVQAKHWLSVEPAWASDVIFDTGYFERALQHGCVPKTAEPMPTWYDRVRRTRQTKWSLSGYCNEKYQLAARLGLHPSYAHTAVGDCFLVYGLLETYRYLAERTGGHGVGVGQTSHDSATGVHADALP
jgi:hypothetical protein